MNRLWECAKTFSFRSLIVIAFTCISGVHPTLAIEAAERKILPVSIQERWQREKLTPSCTIQKRVQEEWSKYHVVLMPGIAHEIQSLFSLYFKAQIRTLEDQFGTQVTYLEPSSNTYVIENAEFLYQELIRIHNEVRKPLIIIGHSKGAAESLLTVLKHPEIVLEGNVSQLILFQAAIKGSPLSAQERMRLPLKILKYLFGSGFNSMEKMYAEQTFDTALNELDEILKATYGSFLWQRMRDELSERILYVRSSQVYPEMGLRARMVLHLFCRHLLTSDCENDGVLLAEDQHHERIGVDLGVVRADHLGLAISGIQGIHVSRLSEEDRRAFSRAIFQFSIEHLLKVEARKRKFSALRISPSLRMNGIWKIYQPSLETVFEEDESEQE